MANDAIKATLTEEGESNVSWTGGFWGIVLLTGKIIHRLVQSLAPADRQGVAKFLTEEIREALLEAAEQGEQRDD